MGNCRLAFIFALGILAFAASAPFSRAAGPSPSPDEPIAAARGAFEALPEGDRKALQDSLGWLGFYNGVVDGAYGKRTIEALIAYQQSLPAAADGVATAKQLGALKSAAAKAKAEVGFKRDDDPATGIRFGAPLKLLVKRQSGAGFTSLASADGETALNLKQSSGDLAALYKSMTSTPNRKITYKYLKPDAFFVVAGEEGDKKFYRRYAVANDRNMLRGFAFVYPKANAKALDPLALAIANAFDPFPVAASPSPPANAPPAPTPAPSPSPAPEPPKLTAVAVVISPGMAVTTLPSAQCQTPTVDGRPVRFLEGGETGGLSRLGGPFGERAVTLGVAEWSDDLVALSLAPVGAFKSELQVASAAPGGVERRVFAALGPVATGAPLFDRRGRLVALVAPEAATRLRADVVLAAPHLTVSAQGLGDGGPTSADEASLSASHIAAKMRDAVVGLYCGP